MDEFTSEEASLLRPYVTNLDKSIFVLTNLPEVVKGALFSRYSRTTKSLRRVLLDEFMLSSELGVNEIFGGTKDHSTKQSTIQTKKAEEFYDRVLVGYGDDSVAELAGAHIAIEDVSILATKTLQDARLGLSPLEKSTRYVYFDNKTSEGNWRYYKDKEVMVSEFADEYVKTCDFAFETYAKLIPRISKFILEKEPRPEGVSERAYASTLRAKTCDILRGLLPAATLTNMGFFGDGRAYEYLITKLYSSELEEFRGVGKTMQEELSKVIPSFVKRANDKHGQSMQQYWKSNLDAVDAFACPINEHSGEAGVFLVESETEDHSIEKLVKYILFSQMNSSISKINEKIGKMNREEKLQIINSYVGERQNRRQKPSRAFEHVNYTFEIVANYGAYRDLHRHRILTQQRQLLTPYLGYKMPKEIVEAGFESEFKEVMKKARETFESMYSKYPNQAQYVVPLAYNIRWYMNLNLREAYHLIELRSAMQGHIDYREIVQKMFGQIEKVHPNLAKGMKFVDMKEYALERLEAEKRIDKKMEELGEKYKK